MNDKKFPFIGAPVYIKYGDRTSTNWVGYIRRINRQHKLVEVGPESIVGSHLRTYPFDRVVPGKFTNRMATGLLAEIERLRNTKWADSGEAKEGT